MGRSWAAEADGSVGAARSGNLMWSRVLGSPLRRDANHQYSHRDIEANVHIWELAAWPCFRWNTSPRRIDGILLAIIGRL